MAIQYNTYVADGLTRTYPSTKHIATKSHCSVLVKNTLTLLWEVVSVDLYSLVNNSIIFEDAVATSLYSNIEIRVADTQDELISSESDIAIVASNITNINIDATNIIPITTVATNIGSVQTTSGSIANVNTVSGSIANVNANGNNIISINANATNISEIVSVATTVVPNIAEILLADDNATTATTQAGIATAQAVLSDASATESEHWANYTVDVAVPEGTGEFSAKHYATKAAQSVAGLSIDAVPTDASANAVSSNGVFDALALKSPLDSPIFTGNVGIGATPSWLSTVYKTVQLHDTANIWGFSNPIGTNMQVGIGVNSTNEYTYTKNGIASMYKQVSGVHSWYTSASGTSGAVIPWTTSMSLSSTGNLTLAGAITALREVRVAMGANNIDLSAGNLFTKTISGAATLTVSGWLATGNANSFILELTNGGSAVVTYFAGVKWASGVVPKLTASGVDILGFYSHDGGTTVRGIVLSKDSK